VRELKGEAASEEAKIQLNLGLNIRIPADYIEQENQRLRMYKRIAGVETESQLANVREELEDRYGQPPAAVANLLEYASLKLQALRVGVTAIDRKRETVSMKFRPDAAIDPAKLARFVSSEPDSQFTPDQTLRFTMKAEGSRDVLNQLRQVLEQLSEVSELASTSPSQTD
jgi:transcription-repair coupling factor (superfamily II helicase)